MRSRMVPPPYVRAFPEYLRKLGYYTTNNSKTDYNFNVPVTAWDDSSRSAHWKNRPDPDQPFFAVFNLGSSHEGSVRRQFGLRDLSSKLVIHDAARLPLPPYYPDTAKTREAWAAYYDVVTMTDRTIGDILQELEDSGLAEETLVVFWGDHGSGAGPRQALDLRLGIEGAADHALAGKDRTGHFARGLRPVPRSGAHDDLRGGREPARLPARARDCRREPGSGA